MFFFEPKILFFRTQPACFAKSKYSLTYIVAAWPYNIQNLIWMQYRKATIDVYSGRCGAVHHFSLKDAHSKVASPECCTLESKYFWSCILILMPDLWIFLLPSLTIFEEISNKNCGGMNTIVSNKSFDPIVCTRNLDKISLQKSQCMLPSRLSSRTVPSREVPGRSQDGTGQDRT